MNTQSIRSTSPSPITPALLESGTAVPLDTFVTGTRRSSPAHAYAPNAPAPASVRMGEVAKCAFYGTVVGVTALNAFFILAFIGKAKEEHPSGLSDHQLARFYLGTAVLGASFGAIVGTFCGLCSTLPRR